MVAARPPGTPYTLIGVLAFVQYLEWRMRSFVWMKGIGCQSDREHGAIGCLNEGEHVFRTLWLRIMKSLPHGIYIWLFDCLFRLVLLEGSEPMNPTIHYLEVHRLRPAMMHDHWLEGYRAVFALMTVPLHQPTSSVSLLDAFSTAPLLIPKSCWNSRRGVHQSIQSNVHLISITSLLFLRRAGAQPYWAP